jgi:TPR repeat protein
MYGDGVGVAADQEAAFNWYQLAAEQGFADAYVSIGRAFQTGRGVVEDLDEAAKWYEKAVDAGDSRAAYFLLILGDEQGNAQAQASLGFMAQSGRGLAQDTAEAASWFQKSAEQGVADAQFMLGAFFRDGTGVQQDYSKAAFWFESAAEQGYARAQRNLGLLCRDGLGLAKNPIEALKWFNLSAGSGDELAKTNRDELAAKMAPAELDEAQRLARMWVKK